MSQLSQRWTKTDPFDGQRLPVRQVSGRDLVPYRRLRSDQRRKAGPEFTIVSVHCGEGSVDSHVGKRVEQVGGQAADDVSTPAPPHVAAPSGPSPGSDAAFEELIET